ncbi:c-type cytochrome biogenesis protein CcsB [Nocardioides currus]|uniref:C-type cytochrome biogenesis protein CcsB n=1 Tax=Nocardioides currus TaxID=2133958 RepID=A0A2R7YY62_9ACTN|nr:c-type cytochrome biogenesis protein CcsB [Nocardioides currus]
MLASLSNLLIYTAIAVYAVAFLTYAGETALRTTRRSTAPAYLGVGPGGPEPSPEPLSSEPLLPDPHDRIRQRADWLGAAGTNVTIVGLALIVTATVARGIAAQRAPWGNMFEFALVGAVALTAAYLAFLARRPVRAFGVWIVGLVLLALGMAVTVLYTPVDALVPVLNSYWLVIHVAAAITGGGIFSVGAVATGLFLVRDRADRRGPTSGRRRYADALPTSTTLAQVMHAAHMLAFPIWTFAVLAGAVWAENSWGRYWGWDPKETWAFITWVLYAAYLHAESTAGWRGRRAALFALGGYAAFLFNFFGVNLWISGLHSYAGV